MLALSNVSTKKSRNGQIYPNRESDQPEDGYEDKRNDLNAQVPGMYLQRHERRVQALPSS
jgi:hypothetical protein